VRIILKDWHRNSAAVLLTLLSCIMLAGCGNSHTPCESDCPPPYSPYADFITQIDEQILRLGSAPVTLSAPPLIRADMVQTIDQSVATVVVENPDILVAQTEGLIDLSGTQGYTTVVVRHGVDKDMVPFTRTIAINNELTKDLSLDAVTEVPATRVAVLGHMRNFTMNSPEYAGFIADVINAYAPDYVYLLGDMVSDSEEEEYALLQSSFIDKLDASSINAIIFTPGNHEYRDVENFHASVAEPDIVITTEHVNLIAVNSNVDMTEVQKHLNAAFANADPAKPTWLLSHHKLWSQHPALKYPHPSFNGDEFLPLVAGKADVLIAGDASPVLMKESPSH
jgi:hypothetical protein